MFLQNEDWKDYIELKIMQSFRILAEKSDYAMEQKTSVITKLEFDC